jgi:hypothetical protein
MRATHKRRTDKALVQASWGVQKITKLELEVMLSDGITCIPKFRVDAARSWQEQSEYYTDFYHLNALRLA